jgi:GxxExxY protein
MQLVEILSHSNKIKTVDDLLNHFDLVVEHKVIIELKSVQELLPVHFKQLLTYLKLSELKLGLLINFNENLIKDGVKRVVNNL